MPIARGYLEKVAYSFTGSTLRIALNDILFSDEAVMQEDIEAGITLADGVNFLVEKYALVRIGRRAFG